MRNIDARLGLASSVSPDIHWAHLKSVPELFGVGKVEDAVVILPDVDVFHTLKLVLDFGVVQ